MTMSVVIGMGLTVPFGNRLLTGYLRGAVVEIVYGVIRWILGLLLTIPMIFEMPPFSVSATSLACDGSHALRAYPRNACNTSTEGAR